jgi:hypothetical protein
VIAHIVLFTPKPSLTIAERRAFAKSVIDTTRLIQTVKRARIGRRIEVDPGYSRSLGDTTYEFAAVLEFDDRSALLSYLADPRHHELGKLFWRCCERTVVSEVEYVDTSDESAADKLAL